MIDTLPLLLDERGRTFDSRYRVVLVAAQRAKQLMRGGKRAQASKFAKETSVALEEVLGNNVQYVMGEEARQALREARSRPERDPEQPLSPEAVENAREIQKHLGVYVDDSPKEEAISNLYNMGYEPRPPDGEM